jgi:DNA polymerase-4
VSWNKVFAKFGSDTDPGDGIVHITPQNYRDVVWPHPCDDLIYIGRATKRKLNAAAIFTIGDVANASDAFMQRRLGKMGGVIKGFANGLDTSPVKVLDPNKADVDYTIKSISNGLTAPHDLVDEASTKALVYLLSESVAQRLRECRFKAKTLGVHVREGNLAFYSRQMQLPAPSNITAELAREAFDLLARNQPIDEAHPIRAISVRASNLVPADVPLQLSIFGDEEARIRQERLDCAIDELRRRFGNSCVRRMVELNDEGMSGLDIKRDNTVHPVGFFNT